MARGRKFSGSNKTYVAAPGTEHIVGELAVFERENGRRIETISCWQLTDLERSVVAETGLVWVSFMGGLPPSFVSGVPMFEARDADGNPIKYDPDAGLTPEERANPLCWHPILDGPRVPKAPTEDGSDCLEEAALSALANLK